MTTTVIEPQQGFQYDFLKSEADIVIGGGAAGVGKTYALLLEAVRNIGIKDFGGVIFRRTTPQIRNEGGLWDTSVRIYPLINGIPRESSLDWIFPNRVKIKFSHLEYESNVLDFQGSQIPFIGFDELTHFTKKMFFYMLSRNRSTCGIKPYIRATCNPDPDSWVAEFISWWIDQETGYPIPSRNGVLRYFIQDSDKIIWGDSKQDVVSRCPHIFTLPEFKDVNPDDLVKSVTFIAGSIYGNKKLLDVNPAYLGNLLSLDENEQLRLLKGNWKIRQDGSALYDFTAINNLFSNFIKTSDDRYITCDVARFGRDLAVILTWIGYRVVKINVFTKSKTTDITNYIEKERERVNCPKSQVLIDQDGVGGGVVDEGGYIGYSGGATSMIDPNTNIKEFYKNLKTQCFYRFSYKVNDNEVSIDLNSIFVDGIKSNFVKIGQTSHDVKSLIIDDLRAIRKKDSDSENRKQINSKEEQKNILGGRSPDFGDSLSMRAFFDLVKTQKIQISIE
jgi:hypothetical protein